MAILISSCWFHFTNLIFLVIKFIQHHVFRINTKDCLDTEEEAEVLSNGFGEEEEEFTSNFRFKFEYQIPEFNSISKEESSSILDTKGDFSAKATLISNCKLLSGKDFSGFVVEPKAMTFKVHESFISRGEDTESNFLSAEDTDSILMKEHNLGEEKPVTFETTKSLCEKENREGFSGFGSDSDSISSSDGYSVKNLVVDLDVENFEEGESSNTNVESSDAGSLPVFLFEENLQHGFRAEYHSSPLERSVRSLSLLDETCSENDSSEDELPLFRNKIVGSNYDLGSSNAKQLSPTDGLNQVEKKASQEELNNPKESNVEGLNDEELDELESLWEHQDLIEQLKMEIKKARAVGLPTILEESESPKMSEDLKSWRIDDKFLRVDSMDELHKFYKSYRERMRKFDILNYQKMYAIGFLQLKNPLLSIISPKPLIPTILSHLSQNLWAPFRRKSSTDASSEKFIKELKVELETVYVGQTCLSWEFLRWQYEKAQELPESDPYRSHQYNQVAGEFQQFQVIVQRFIENESFQGPRLPNYVKNRCVLRNLLQVPVIKADCLKDKMERKRKGNDAITSEMLQDIMEESIRVFWEFIKADKDEDSVLFKGFLRNQIELQDSSDYDLLVDVQASLQKKEKRLKDIRKTGNCIVKKFKKSREDGSNKDLFFSQVDMKLVSRVLKKSRLTTDQLVWCHMKLNKIKVNAERKLHRESAFLLFPC